MESKELMLYGGKIAVYCENYTKHVNTLCGEVTQFLNVKARGM
jgi:hypothetical protein